ncbi:hypothetical protein [uncultured Stenotrophomonas sp.]|uniref:hypothetical protein n=1 Tax=uncultured Stenotrophomonas sp. TaxID=165438 RepID=UPI0025D81167|nr:hypothetical protein [uncultured Stenotrophomonas sp.]
MSVESEAARIFDHIDKACNVDKRALTPLFKVGCDEVPYHAGTAFGIELSGVKYLVTAAHVFDKDESNDCDSKNEIFCFSEGKLKQIARFDLLHARKNGGLVDMAVVTPRDVEIESIFEEFFAESDFELGDVRTDQYVAACGFPATKNKVRWGTTQLTQAPYAYCGRASAPSVCVRAGFDAATHFCFDIFLKKTFTARQKEIRAPDPHGISGGPVFVIHDFSDAATLMKPKLRGIVVEQKPYDRVVACVKIEVVVEAIRQAPRPPTGVEMVERSLSWDSGLEP